MNYPKIIAFIGGAIAGNYLVRRYITNRRHIEPVKFEQVQNEVAISKYTKPKDNNSPNESPYAALYSKK